MENNLAVANHGIDCCGYYSRIDELYVDGMTEMSVL